MGTFDSQQWLRYFPAARRADCADIAQLVEQLIRNEQVVGSSPTVGSDVCSPSPSIHDRTGMRADESGVMRFVLTLLCALLPVGQHAFAEGNAPFTVVLDPGHGGSNLGAPARFSRGRYEKHYTLPISKKIANLLQQQGVRVLLTRTEDTDVTLRERVEFANRARADLFVSIHLNATPGLGRRGMKHSFLVLKQRIKPLDYWQILRIRNHWL